MKRVASFGLLFLAGGFGYASSLAVYQDKSLYTNTFKNNFIGFSQGIEAKCDGTNLALVSSVECPSQDRLCQQLSDLKQSEQALQTLQANTTVLSQLMTLPQPGTLDASAWITTARMVAQEQSGLAAKEDMLSAEVRLAQQRFEKQAPSREAQKTIQSCNDEVELSIPYGYISFATHYEADIQNENEIAVTKYLAITNRSGIDVHADTATFYYRLANQPVYPVHFTPWIVSKIEPKPQGVYEKSMRQESVAAAPMVAMANAPKSDMTPPVAIYEDARVYTIKALDLPSSGEALLAPVATWKAPLHCEIRAYSYQNTKAFQVCSFTPAQQIDANQWKIKSGKELINDRALGEYRKDTYDLYTKVEEDIQIQRKPIINKEGESGIFGGTVRKKDGFTLTLVNKSDKAKTLTLIERIPSSTNEAIKSKLLAVNAQNKVNYTMLEDGGIEMKIDLAANENKQIDVLFELSYDKELKVVY